MFLMQKNIAMVFKNKLFNVPVMLLRCHNDASKTC